MWFDLEVNRDSLVELIHFTVSLTIRFVIQSYLLAVAVVYFKIVSTHVFLQFEPKYFKLVKDKLLMMNKHMDKF